MADFRQQRGVTLMEMLVVLGVICVLAAITLTVTFRIESQSKENALRSAFALLGSSLREYHEFKGQFPAQPERIAWQTPMNAQDYQTAVARATAHTETMVLELRAVPDSRQVLEKVSPSLVKADTATVDLQYLCDPWGTVLDYICAPEDTFPELISAGPDKRFGTGDDLSNKGQR